MAKNFKQLHSSYWLDIDQFEYDVDRMEESGQDIIGLIKYRNVISNFVNILTGKQITVQFATSGDSYTDGKRIVISANRDAGKFDINVGLALHEASHIVLTDFKVLPYIMSIHDTYNGTTDPYPAIREAYNLLPGEAKPENDPYGTAYNIKNLINIIEDRRIDRYVRNTAPGYCGYYDALYEEYFINATTTKAIRDVRYRGVKAENYLFHILSMVNPDSDPKALPGLERIFSMIDLQNIDRLKSTTDVAVLAIQVWGEIVANLPVQEPVFEKEEDGKEQASEAGTGEGEPSDTGDGSEGEETESGESLSEGEQFSPSMERRIDKSVREMMTALQGDIKKSKLSKGESRAMQAMTENVDILSTTDAGGTYKGVTVLLLENLTPSKLWDESGKRQLHGLPDGLGGFFAYYRDDNWRTELYTEIIDSGFGYGSRISKQLRTRAEERTLEYNRLNQGKIDPRRIAYASTVEDIFYRTRIERYPDSYIHISLDASGSMDGIKWRETLRFTSALAKGCALAKNIHLTIDVRIDAGKYPAVIIMYDSKRHTLSHFRTMFSAFEPNSSTPEGLCFNALSNWIQKRARGRKSLFINFSDGEPCYSLQGFPNYCDESAWRHTAQTVRGLKSSGISVLSYYIADRGEMHYGFERMYGDSAHLIQPSDMGHLVRTINENQMVDQIVEWV